jgi:hypothetical protein
MIKIQIDMNRMGKRATEGESPVKEDEEERWYPE